MCKPETKEDLCKPETEEVLAENRIKGDLVQKNKNIIFEIQKQRGSL